MQRSWVTAADWLGQAEPCRKTRYDRQNVRQHWLAFLVCCCGLHPLLLLL